MTAESVKARMERGDKMLKLFEVNRLSLKMLGERFGMSVQGVKDALLSARERRERAKEGAQ